MQLFLNLIVIFTFSWHYGSKKRSASQDTKQSFYGHPNVPELRVTSQADATVNMPLQLSKKKCESK